MFNVVFKRLPQKVKKPPTDSLGLVKIYNACTTSITATAGTGLVSAFEQNKIIIFDAAKALREKFLSDHLEV